MKRLPATCAVLCVFIALILFPEASASGVKSGLAICIDRILPSLFPFFIASSLLTNLGATAYIGELLAPVSAKLFHVSGAGGSAFIIGLTGGYPLGASYIADMYTNKLIKKQEAEKLLIFCNNSGPAFIIGACGVAAFHSSAVGIFLYAVHILAALIGGIMLSGKEKTTASFDTAAKDMSFANAFTASVKSSINALINVCGFILAFSILVSMFDFYIIAGNLSQYTGLELSFCRTFLVGILELGSSIGCMTSLSTSSINLALAAFILGWGGISVHFQTFAVISDTDIKTAQYIIGRFNIAVIGAIIAYFGAMLFF